MWAVFRAFWLFLPQGGQWLLLVGAGGSLGGDTESRRPLQGRGIPPSPQESKAPSHPCPWPYYPLSQVVAKGDTAPAHPRGFLAQGWAENLDK